MTRRGVVVAVCAVLGASAILSYAVGDRMGALIGTVALRRPLADAVPRELGGWKGTDEPLDRHAVELIKMDDYVRRSYRRADGDSVLLYVAYHGNKERGMQTYYHNATVCFTSAGWTIESQQLGTETLHDLAREVPVCRYVFVKEDKRLSVLTFFKVDGELLDQSPRNKPIWMLLDKLTPRFDDSPGTFVQVQIVADVEGRDAFKAAEVQSRFLRDFGRAILSAVEVGAQ